MKKHIKGLLSYGILIVVVLIYVLFRVGITFNLTKIMPEFATQIYSEANMIGYDVNIIKSAKNQLNKQINKVRNDIYSERDYVEKGIRKILYLNEDSLTKYISSFSETTKKQYDDLLKVDNILYIQNKDLGYDANKRQNGLNLYIYPLTAIDRGMYFELEAEFYKPITIKKESISNLQIGDKYNFEYPIGTSSEAIELVYNGDKKFSYNYDINLIGEDEKVETKTLTEEFKLKDYNKNEYEILQSNNRRIEKLDKVDKVYVLKDATYGNVDGDNFLFLANYLLVAEEKKIQYSDTMRFGDFMASVLSEISTSSNVTKTENENNREIERLFSSIYINYVVYDKKGYITDLYTFTNN